jgi:tRNA(Ile)-lysidine synthase
MYIPSSQIRNIALLGDILGISIIPQNTYQLIADKRIAAVDLDKLRFPLTIRPWQVGDYFYPLGMQRRKKLSDFLIDLKVPILLKQKVWVVTSENEIVWVIGYRLDDRFKITQGTKEVYELKLTSKASDINSLEL